MCTLDQALRYDLVWLSLAGDDYSVLTNLNFVIEPSSLRRHCIALSIVQDEIGEGMEQFEFFFENLPNEMAGVGTPATTCVNIIDDVGKWDLGVPHHNNNYLRIT